MIPDCPLDYEPGSAVSQGTIYRKVQTIICSQIESETKNELDQPEGLLLFEGPVWCMHMGDGKGKRSMAQVGSPSLIEEYFIVVTDSLSTPRSFERLGLMILDKNYKPWMEALESKIMSLV